MKVEKGWTLFLDRDGVINKELNEDYVKHLDEFHWEHGALEAIATLSKLFSKVYIVTNQRGVGIGVMSEADLKHIHDYMLKEIVNSGGRLDGIYYCADADRNSLMRKPRPGMANKAKSEHPEIDFAKSVMVGNSISDMEFGRSVGMTTVFIDDKGSRNRKKEESMDYIFFTLKEFADSL